MDARKDLTVVEVVFRRFVVCDVGFQAGPEPQVVTEEAGARGYKSVGSVQSDGRRVTPAPAKK